MAEWSLLIYFLFPLPLALLVLLSLPAPFFIRSLCLKITELVFIKIPGTPVSIYSFLLTLSTILLILTSWTVWSHSQKNSIKIQDHRCYRWRFERNFWISVLAFTVWLVLGRFRSALKEAEKYRKALKENETKSN